MFEVNSLKETRYYQEVEAGDALVVLNHIDRDISIKPGRAIYRTTAIDVRSLSM
jgi:hypothetical protein